MELQYAICARYAEVTPDGFFAVFGGGIDSIQLNQLPGAVPMMSLLIRLTARTEELQEEHRLRGDLFSPREERQPLEVDFPLPTNLSPGRQNLNSEQPHRPISFNCALSLTNLTFPEAGEYTFRISLDGRQLGNIGLFVNKAGQQGGQE